MRDRNKLNRQDTILGGMILAGFVVIAVIAALFTLAPWRGERATDVPKTTVSSSTQVTNPAAPAAPAAPSTN
jgi:cytochrome oxidase assembly protein ShyY1